MSDTVKAKWIAPFEAVMPDGTKLVPNETIVEIPAGEAKDSDNWRPERTPKKGDS